MQTTLSCQVANTSSDFQSKHIDSVVNILASGAQKLLKVARHLYDSQVGLEMNQTHYPCKSPSVCKHSHFAAKNIYINFCWSTIDLHCLANSQNGQIMQGGPADNQCVTVML